MNYLRLALMLLTLGLIGFATNCHAESALLNKHLVKLLGSWEADDHKLVVFNPNRTCIYQRKKYICAIADGSIQIKKRKALVVVLPYRFQSGKLLITDHNVVTTYTRVP